MHRRKLLTVIAIAAIAFAPSALSLAATPGYVTAAVNDPGRPAAETKLDASRKPAEMLVFAGVRPGDKVADLLPGGGYFTRMFSKVVGVNGHVYALDPDDGMKMHGDTLVQMTKSPAYANVTILGDMLTDIKAPQPLDVVWTSQNYHDLHNAAGGVPDLVAFNKRVFAMLKPGGVYVILDHAAAAGAPKNVTETLHRIEAATVKAEVLAAGFVEDGESDVLRNPADDHTLIVFNPKIRGKTDQFILKFRKPK